MWRKVIRVQVRGDDDKKKRRLIYSYNKVVGETKSSPRVIESNRSIFF